MSLIAKLQKNTTIKMSDILEDSKFFAEKDMITTAIPVMNVALSGSLTGGFTPGLTMWAGPSKHFKTAFSLLMAKAYMDQYPDSVLLYYDSEFGTPQSYFDSFGIDKKRVLHTPVTDVEQLKFDVTNQLKELDRKDHVVIVIDSIGNLASKKETEDALNEKSVADMSRAKALKSLFRIVTPQLVIKNIPMIVINHTYQELALFPKTIVGGGTGSYYGSDNIFIVGRQQEKTGTEVTGYSFIINVEKSRYVREKSKIPVTVSYEGGIGRYSGLIDMALESGHVIKPMNGWYQRVDMETGEVDEKKYRLKETETKLFWTPILACPLFNKWVKDRYQISHGPIMQHEDTVDEVYETIAED
jgi:RecA/RadA recombinase